MVINNDINGIHTYIERLNTENKLILKRLIRLSSLGKGAWPLTSLYDLTTYETNLIEETLMEMRAEEERYLAKAGNRKSKTTEIPFSN